MVPLLIILIGLEIGISIMGPLLPQLQREFQISAGRVALALAVYNGIRLLFNVPMGRLIARSALPAMFAAGGAILAAGAMITALAPSFPVVLAGRAVMGVGSALFILTVQFWLARAATPENKAQLFSYHQLAGLTGSALGPALGGLVAGWLTWRYSFGLPLVAGLIALLAGRQLPHPAAGQVAPPVSSGVPAQTRLRPGEVLGPGMSMLAFMFFHAGIVMTLIPLFAAREVRMGPAAIGSLLMLGTLQRFGAAVLGGRLVTRFGTRRVVLVGLVVLALSVLSFLAVDSPAGLIVGISLISWANLGGSFVIAMITDLVPEAHWGTALGVNRTMGDIGAMIAPLLVGFVSDQRGFEAAFLVATGFLLAAAGLAAVFTALRAPRKEAAPERSMAS
ncbi:MAG: MFS transporter [Armatimonadetes bacterium]|nr:MFS transporter [Armatimonadota bacterium]